MDYMTMSKGRNAGWLRIYASIKHMLIFLTAQPMACSGLDVLALGVFHSNFKLLAILGLV